MLVVPRIRGRNAKLLCFIALSVFIGMTFMVSNRVSAQTSPTLGTATTFAVLGSASVDSTGPTVVNGNLGISPGSALTEVPPIVIPPPGARHLANAVALQARNDAVTAYNSLAIQPCTQDLTGQDLGGLTLTPGVYCFTSSAQLTGTLTLDATSNPGGVFIFKMVTSLTTASASSVNVIGGGSVCNVWWQVGSSATLGTTTSLAGNILASDSITLTTGASMSGRAFALNAAITLDTNVVGSPACIPAASSALSLTKDDGGATFVPGGTINYTLSFQNTGNMLLENVTLTDAIPLDTTFNAGASTAGWNCAVSPCTFNLGTLLPGTTGSVVFAVTVNNPTAATVISNSATITSGAVVFTATDTTSIVVVPTATSLPTATTPPVIPTDVPPGATAVPPNPTDVPPNATGVPPIPTDVVPIATDIVPVSTEAAATATAIAETATTIAATSTAVALQTRSVQIAGTQQSSGGSQAVIGLPNTGGGPPQATYWIVGPRR